MQPRYKRLLRHSKAAINLYTPDDPNSDHLARAQSAAYYAVFHAVSQHCADVIIPHNQGDEQFAAWNKFYRALNHSAFNKGAITRHRKELPADMTEVMRIGAVLKTNRARADYDPAYAATGRAALEDVNLAEIAITLLEQAPQLHLIITAAHLLTPYHPDP